MFKASPVFEANLKATKPVVVNQGGTSSGKTYSILQALFVLLAAGTNLVCTVVGQDIPNLKAGALRDAQDIVRNSEQLRTLIKSYNKSERIYEFHNGSLMEFKSYDDFQDAKSGKRDYLFINEANGIAYAVVKELMLRTRIRTFIDYNPNAEFWAHEKLHGQPDVQLIISDHRHNPFLSQLTRDKIEALKTEDMELWRVYARGKTGKIEGLVLRNWSTCKEIPEGAKYLGTGIDFGFTNDPTTAIDVYLQNGELWADELIYSTGLTNPDIHKALLAIGASRRYDIVADSAEPKSIEELRRLGLPIEGAHKGPDSINASIDTLKRYHLNVTLRSTNLRKELSNYKWKQDRQTGLATNVPVDAFNHTIDALRYVALNRLQKPAGAPITVSQSFGAVRRR
jgi:phage terminase large subunit